MSAGACLLSVLQACCPHRTCQTPTFHNATINTCCPKLCRLRAGAESTDSCIYCQVSSRTHTYLCKRVLILSAAGCCQLHRCHDGKGAVQAVPKHPCVGMADLPLMLLLMRLLGCCCADLHPAWAAWPHVEGSELCCKG